MLVIGLTGQSGAGKGTVAELFARHGLFVIDADRVYHDLLTPPSPCLDDIVARFGGRMLTEQGTLNRRALGDLVFSDADALADLNRISHHHVMKEIRRQLEQLRRQNVRAAVLDAPQLFEAEANRDCSLIVSVLADRDLRLERIMRRDGIDAARAESRMASQKSDAFFRAHSDYVIENNASPDLLLPAVERILTDVGVLDK